MSVTPLMLGFLGRIASNPSAPELRPVQCPDGLDCLFFLGHIDKAEAPVLAFVILGRQNPDGFHLSISLENLP